MSAGVRAAVAIVTGLILFGVGLGFAAYHTPTWDGTKVVSGWDCVRLIALKWYPIILACCAVFVVLVFAVVEWVSRGGKS